MKLYNHDTQQYEEVSSMDATPLLARGSHTLQQGAKIKMLDPKTSSEVEVDANVANDYAKMGFAALEPQAPTSTLKEDAQGLAYGVVQGLTLGTGGAIGTKLGLIEPSTIEHLEEVTPETIIAGELLSFAVPGLGELGAGAKAGRALGAVQRAPRLAGELLVKAVESKVGDLGFKGVRGAIKKAIPSAVEGGAWALGQQLTDDVVHDRDFSAEEWARQGLLGAGLGGAFGAVVEFGIPAGAKKISGLLRGEYKGIDDLSVSQRKLRSSIDALHQPFTDEGQQFRQDLLGRTFEDRERDVIKNLKEHLNINEKVVDDLKAVAGEELLEPKQAVESLGGRIGWINSVSDNPQFVIILPEKRIVGQKEMNVNELLHDIAGDVVIDNKLNPRYQDILFESGVQAIGKSGGGKIIDAAKKMNIPDGWDLLQFQGNLSATLFDLFKARIPGAAKDIKFARSLAADTTDRLMKKLGAVDADGLALDPNKLAHDLMWTNQQYRAAEEYQKRIKDIIGEDIYKSLKASKTPLPGTEKELDKKLSDMLKAELEKERSNLGNLFADLQDHTDRIAAHLDDIEKQRAGGYRSLTSDVSEDEWMMQRPQKVSGQQVNVPGMKPINQLDIAATVQEAEVLNNIGDPSALQAARLRQTLEAAGENSEQGSVIGGALGALAGSAVGHPVLGGFVGAGLGGGFVPAFTGQGAARGVLKFLRDPLGPAKILYTLENIGIRRDAALLKAIDNVLEGKPLDKAKSATLMLLTKPSANETEEETRTRFLNDIETLRNNPELLEADVSPYVRRAAPKMSNLRLQTTLTAVEELMKHLPKANEGSVLSATNKSVNATKMRDFDRKLKFMSNPELLMDHPLATREDIEMVSRVFPHQIEKMRQLITIAIQQKGETLVDQAKRKNAQRQAFLFGIQGLADAKPMPTIEEEPQASAGNIKGQISTKSLMPSEALQLPASDNPLKGSIPELTPSQQLQQRAEGANF